jgi:isopentenyl-diphosphate delta-isomerase
MSNIIVVDDNDNIIGNKDRELVDKEGLRYRVSALWIKNSQGQILLARRAYTKSHNPGKWGPAVAGTVEEGESYEDNIIREAKEELGLKDLKLIKCLKIKNDNEHKFYTQWFISIVNKNISDFKIQTDEVAEIKWFSKDELINKLENNPEEFLNGVKKILFILN